FSGEAEEDAPTWVAHYHPPEGRAARGLRLFHTPSGHWLVGGHVGGLGYRTRPLALLFDDRSTLLRDVAFRHPDFQEIQPRAFAMDSQARLVMGGYGAPVGPGTHDIISARFSVLSTAGLPTFSQTPQSITMAEGSNGVLQASVSGASPLSFQWRLNGSNIPGATTTQLTVRPPDIGTHGDYSLAVSNAGGTVVSGSARVRVVSRVQVMHQPGSMVVIAGESAALGVSATGHGLLRYQWRRNGQVIPGAEDSELRFSSVSESDAGEYTVEVTDRWSSVISEVASLRISEAAHLAFRSELPQPAVLRFPQYGLMRKDSAGRIYSAYSGAGVTLHRSDGSAEWNTPFLGELAAMDVSADGKVILSGFVDTAQEDYLVTLYRANGSVAWSRSYGGSAGGYDRAVAAAFDPVGNVLVTGWGGVERAGDQPAFVTLKYSSSGQQLWKAVYRGPNNAQGTPGALGVNSSGKVLVAGHSPGEGIQRFGDLVVVQYDSLGRQNWE
ncbi:MAG: hypothetical protein FJ405_12700, partial [Verrucomicrobia bacterium]|nr:hypothetical protein [Verrucomicrobiota bacterium]